MGAGLGRAEVDSIDDPQWLFTLQNERRSPGANLPVSTLREALESLDGLQDVDLEWFNWLERRLVRFRALLDSKDSEGRRYLEQRHPVGIRSPEEKHFVKGLESYSHDFACAIHAYTLEWPKEKGRPSLYELVNKIASSPERGDADSEKFRACLPYIRRGRAG